MEDLVLAKFTQNQQLKEALLKTGNLKLVEGKNGMIVFGVFARE